MKYILLFIMAYASICNIDECRGNHILVWNDLDNCLKCMPQKNIPAHWMEQEDYEFWLERYKEAQELKKSLPKAEFPIHTHED